MNHCPPVKEAKGVEIDSDHLLRVIEEGDATRILSEQNLTHGFNELLKHDLIMIKDGSVCLTEKGRQAKISGIKKYLTIPKEEPIPSTAPKKHFLNERKTYSLILLILLGFSFLLIMVL